MLWRMPTHCPLVKGRYDFYTIKRTAGERWGNDSLPVTSELRGRDRGPQSKLSTATRQIRKLGVQRETQPR